MTGNRQLALVAAALVLFGGAALAGPEGELALREEEAIRAAIDRVAASVVSIETIGGLERAGGLLLGTGPTTGLVVSADGYIVSSAFNFLQQPSSVLVTLDDGTWLPARQVATDHSRMLVLLKVDPPQPLPVAEVVPESDMRVGQWAIAVGRTFEGPPSVSVGILSAVKRIWGKAIQTDARVSPTNYGGPLVDIRGRVLGVLVPLSPEGTEVVSGAEWYDSGIGFAVPLEHVLEVLPRFKEADLRPGLLGASFERGDPYGQPPVIAACRPNSPAAKAGLAPGDRIVEIDGAPVVRQMQVRERIVSRYAGETVRIAVLRGDERLEREIELVDKLLPYEFPFLGILPSRAVPEKAGEASGVVIRYVFPGSPAEQADLRPGDVISSFEGEAVKDADALRRAVAQLQPGATARLEVERSGEKLAREVQLARLPEQVPESLPAARPDGGQAEGERPPTGAVELKLPEFPNDCLLYVPAEYDPAVIYGVAIWLSADGQYDDAKLLAQWKARCDEHDLLLLAPKTAPAAGRAERRWDPASELPMINKALERVFNDYHIDRSRVVACGEQGGGRMSWLLAFSNREAIRGIAALEATPPERIPDNDPAYPLACLVASPKAAGDGVPAGVERLREQKYPVTILELPAKGGPRDGAAFDELLRWIDSLDRI